MCVEQDMAAEHLRWVAIQRYALRKTCIIPGSLESQTSGRAHQISWASATAASAPPVCWPLLNSRRISSSNSLGDKPRSVPTRGSCNGASANPRFCSAGTRARTILTQKTHSASKNSQPRAWRPLLSVNSEVSEIMAVHRSCYYFAIGDDQNLRRILGRVRVRPRINRPFCGRCLAA